LPILDALARRAANFIQAYLSSSSDTVQSVTNMAVFSPRMLSLIGRNAQLCCSRFSWTLEHMHIDRVHRTAIERLREFGRGVEFSFIADSPVVASWIRSIDDLVLTAPEFTRSDVADIIYLLAHL
jgi:hypothetical protein